MADVWQTALEAHGQPTGRQMEPLVKPYTNAARSSPELRERVAQDYERRGARLHRRAQLGHALDDVLGGVVSAASVVTEALDLETDADRITSWLDDAEQAAKGLAEIVDQLQAAADARS